MRTAHTALLALAALSCACTQGSDFEVSLILSPNFDIDARISADAPGLRVDQFDLRTPDGGPQMQTSTIVLYGDTNGDASLSDGEELWRDEHAYQPGEAVYLVETGQPGWTGSAALRWRVEVHAAGGVRFSLDGQVPRAR